MKVGYTINNKYYPIEEFDNNKMDNKMNNIKFIIEGFINQKVLGWIKDNESYINCSYTNYSNISRSYNNNINDDYYRNKNGCMINIHGNFIDPYLIDIIMEKKNIKTAKGGDFIMSINQNEYCLSFYHTPDDIIRMICDYI